MLMISVCMATFNGERFLRQQLESVLVQLPQALDKAEVIVADDGSTDKTLSVIDSLQDGRVHVLPVTEHLGPIYNFERALKAARGDVVFLADQDDLWLPGKVSRCLESLKSCDLVLHDAYMLYEDNSSTWKRGRLFSEIRPYVKGVFRNWLVNSYTGCCMAFRRNVLDASLPFPKNLPMHDQWIGLVAEKYFKVEFLPEPLVEYRQHSGNATHIGNSPAGVLQKIRWRVDLAKALVSRRG